jgi:hypothetical protein
VSAFVSQRPAVQGFRGGAGEACTLSFERTFAPVDMDLYAHVRIIVGVVISLGLTHLLRGIANLIQHPKKERI